jgi:type IV pilus assembly protein PilB
MAEQTITKVTDVDSIKWEECKIPEHFATWVSYDSAERYRFLPFEEEEDHIKVAVVDDNDLNTQNALRFFARRVEKSLHIYVVQEDIFQILFRKFKNPGVEIGKALDDLEKVSAQQGGINVQNQELRQREENVNVLQEAPVAKMVEVILKNAVDGNASDIHIEPSEANVRVRYRVDGVLYNSITLPAKVGPAIVSRIKILSNLKIDEKRKPQDGRFRISDLGRAIDFRVSTLPISHGEKVVLRILDTSAGIIKLEELGFVGRDLDVIRKVIEEPYGIILVTGPTGSGKSTTLYAILHLLNKEGVNIITLEDPVEYMVEGISQSQVKPEIGYTFASGLRSILRQDPDIVMVGEIRDSETAELAIHAALTGHLVLSTLHTNSSIGAIPRLVDMGLQPFLIASAMRMVVGQRLVRKICSECKEPVKNIPDDAKRMMQYELKRLSPEVLTKRGIDLTAPLTIFHGKGCSHCRGGGMKGRVAISEVLEIDEYVTPMIDTDLREMDLEKQSRKRGFISMKQDGILKVLQGLTTIEEVARVTEDSSQEEAIEAKE